jgi:siroheme synthase
VRGTLGDIASWAADVAAPAVIVIGEVVGLASLIAPSVFDTHQVRGGRLS